MLGNLVSSPACVFAFYALTMDSSIERRFTYLAAGMVVQERRDVVDLVVDDHPAVVLLRVWIISE